MADTKSDAHCAQKDCTHWDKLATPSGMDKPTFHHHLAVIRDMMANASTAPDDALSPEELVERWKLKKRVLDYAFATGIEQSLQRAVAEASAGTQDKDM